nr:Papilin [Hymenolepis microstoma]
MIAAIVLMSLIALGSSDHHFKDCTMPIDGGPCRGYFPSWGMDAGKGECVQFIYGGCRGNENRFASREECEETCENVDDSSEEENVCKLPLETGPCRGSYIKWGMNSRSGQCESFVYGGCGGNANNFDTEEECELFCIHG